MSGSDDEKKIRLPMVVVRGQTMIPGNVMVMLFKDDIIAKALSDIAAKDDKRVFLVTERNKDTGEPFPVGTISDITDIKSNSDGSVNVTLKGITKATISDIDHEKRPSEAIVIPENRMVMEKEAQNDPVLASAIRKKMNELVTEYFTIIKHSMNRGGVVERYIGKFLEIENLSEFLEAIAGSLNIDYKVKQTFLELSSINHRFEILAGALNTEIQVNKLKAHIDAKVKKNLDKSHKDFVLREQIKVLNEELDGESSESESDELSGRCKKLDAAPEIKEKIEKEIKRFKKLSSNSPEANVSRSYITTLLDIPWETMSEETGDVEKVRKTLDEDHYGLEKVKERVVEALAVRNITNKGDAPILCLAGPPGTGKTSIAQSVARAMNKKYIRISLGGVRDEAEIRGHRRTYVGAIPGRIINGLIDAGVKNPLILLDEIDKISNDYSHGDTQASLLEVLDPEQNSKFTDHYVELPVDLSEVLFITTANDLSQISQPLLDRMEVIELNSYTEKEKIHIAKEHLIPKQIVKNGLTKGQLKISDSCISSIITQYTAEAGVRTLERKIAAICRKAVTKLYDGGELRKDTIRVTKNNLEEFLGTDRVPAPKYSHKPAVGIIHGLAWTSVGGTVLEIEVGTMQGHESLILTGQMGDVMKESARIALSYVRSVIRDKADDYFDNLTIHLHIPEGAVPKDGPSAGITMATAIYSAITGRKIDGELAMTGEITLRGMVLPVGGLKEKLVAAGKGGMKRVIVPMANKSDIESLDDEITGDLEIIFVAKMKEVLDKALV